MRDSKAFQAAQRLQHPSPTRRWDVDHAILWLLGSGPRTASTLLRDLEALAAAQGPGPGRGEGARLRGTTIDKRTLSRHLRYLRRDGHVRAGTQIKILLRGDGTSTAWLTRIYRAAAPDPAPPSRSPSADDLTISVIHGPFHGPEGAARFRRWLTEPQADL